ncbi:MAG: hypothetical protein JRI36_01035 [Deltaproteobacteria bacterium]|nr:hypothetical protein [Deltaproteobacteria bacterium]
MNAKERKGRLVGFVTMILFALALALPARSSAVPEPDNIVYGVAADSAVTIRLEVDGTQICSYHMGDDPDAGVFYILRVPMDSAGDPLSGSARPGDTADIYINEDTSPTQSLILGERGSIFRLDLGTTDDDGDGIPDQWEQRLADANGSDDIYDASDVDPKADFDNDGFSNAREFLAGSDAADTEKIPCCIADLNTDGDVDGTDLAEFGEDYPFGTCECPSDMDGDGDIDDMDFLFFTEDYGRMDCYW